MVIFAYDIAKSELFYKSLKLLTQYGPLVIGMLKLECLKVSDFYEKKWIRRKLRQNNLVWRA